MRGGVIDGGGSSSSYSLAASGTTVLARFTSSWNLEGSPPVPPPPLRGDERVGESSSEMRERVGEAPFITIYPEKRASATSSFVKD